MTAPRHVLVLGDQLTRAHGPLAGADPARTVVLTVESVGLVRATRARVQKAALFFGALRRFAADLEADGFTVDHHRLAPSFEAAIAAHLERWPGATLEVMRPNDRGVAEALRAAARAAGGDVRVVPNPLRLVDDEAFDAWAAGRKRWVMEDFYRFARARLGWLMDPDDPTRPEGGVWNLDAQNRRVPPRGHRFAPPPRFAPDAVQDEVLDDVARTLPDHPGRLRPFDWPITRAQALTALDRFVAERLPGFGPYEDALVHGERTLDHSQLSVPLNLGLLHPREVLEAVERAYREGDGRVPLQSAEGFGRQVLGWREYVAHVDRVRGPELERANALAHHAPLPDAYGTGATRMACFADAWANLDERGWSHHIQRLMVFGNLALGLGVDPIELTAWFTSLHVDAQDWVMVPNVMGMSQHADGGGMTTKPYVSGGAYLNRMGDHCRRCPFDPGSRIGPTACPFTVGYWDFVDRHQERFARHPRMAVAVKAWRAHDAAEQAAVRARTSELRERLP
ncbi:MAG: cryptochrome/photolyase family protein [Trueperaceae bacterium]|nr:cryptochrome/photolyase family protein [Trueperaceae bacterium]